MADRDEKTGKSGEHGDHGPSIKDDATYEAFTAAPT